MAQALAREPGVKVLNDVVLNQVLVRFDDDDELTGTVIERVQQSGACWMGGSTFRGQKVMRISVVSWQTTALDIDASVASILQALRSSRQR